MRIFITGGSGFVGNATCKYFSQLGHQVFAMSRNDSSDALIRKTGAYPVRCDLCKITEHHIANADAVIHTAALVASTGNWEAFYQSNVVGTANVINAAKKAMVKKFINISTDSVIWHGQDIIDADENYPIIENNPFLYGKSKMLAEDIVMHANEQPLFQTISLRPRLIWGPGDKNILPGALRMWQKKRFFWINDGSYLTSTTYIDNLLYAIDLSLMNGKGGSIYFIADEHTISLKNFFTQLFLTRQIRLNTISLPKNILRFTGKCLDTLWNKLKLENAPPVSYQAICFMSSSCTLNISKARIELGYSEKVSFHQGLEILKKNNSFAN